MASIKTKKARLSVSNTITTPILILTTRKINQWRLSSNHFDRTFKNELFLFQLVFYDGTYTVQKKSNKILR